MQRLCLVAAVAVLVTVGVLAALWAADSRVHEGRVARNVVLAGQQIGGLTPTQLRSVLESQARQLQEGRARVSAKGGGFAATGAELGIRLAEPATLRGAMRAGREGPAPAQLASWLTSFISPRRATLEVSVHAATVRATVAERDPGPRTAPVEPTIRYREGTFEAVDGAPGEGIDAELVMEAIPEAAANGSPVTVFVRRSGIAPRFSRKTAEDLAAYAQETVDQPLVVQADGARATMPLDTVRSWITTKVEGAAMQLAIDTGKVMADLPEALSNAGKRPKDATARVTGGQVVVVPGEMGTGCCADSSPLRVERALLREADRGPNEPLVLALRPLEPARTADDVAKLGIKEQISSFTTQHAAGQGRVKNIHRIADLLQGTIIEPGEALSINQTVGRRTAAKGFVVAGVIEQGRFSESVGGGISQFATTLFNAAFFAGLDFGEYQSHSIYISRYPYGREATLSYPHPDLVIKNNTPYGVLLWPTYTSSSITVSLWSTKYIEATQVGQSKGSRGNCTRVTTTRRRVWPDGRSETDQVYATYRPAEGVNC